MRLAVFTNQFPGPVCTFFARDMRGLIDAGIEVDVFPIYPLDENLWQYVPDILNETVLPRSRVHHLTLVDCLGMPNFLRSGRKLARFIGDSVSISASAFQHGVEPVAKSMYVVPKAWTWAQQQADKYDHVLAYWGNYTASCAYLFHRIYAAKVPFSLFLHASIDLYNGCVDLRRKLLYADQIITCSEFNRKFILQQFASLDGSVARKIHVHHHGLELDRLPINLNNRPSNKIIAVGRFAKQKGFDFLIRAVRELKDRNVNVEFELVGDGEEENNLRSLVRELDITNMVTFSGWLPPDRVPLAISRSTVFVHSSPDLGDGVPNVIKEAMAVGTPVIGSRIAGIPELLDGGKCGILVQPKDVRQLADAITVLLAKESLRQNYADAARKRAEEKFDLWRNGRNLAAFLGQASVHNSAASF